MATFISSLILYGFAAAVFGLIAKLIYDIQQTKKENKEVDELCKIEAEFEAKDDFQKLAGIKPHNPTSFGELNMKLNEKVVEELKKEFQNSEFPAPDPSIPVTTAKLTTIGGNYGDSDPLASVPMSRVSKKAKQKMAEIAKQDISVQLEQNAEKFASIFPEAVEYTDEYFKPDYSQSKQKTKKKNPKQDVIGVVDENKPFKKTRKKPTKKKKDNE